MANIKKLDRIPESGTVTVACNINTGIVLQLYEMEENPVPVLGLPGTTRMEKTAVAAGEPVTLFGPALAVGLRPKCLIVGGYAMTSGVDAQFMAKWMDAHKNDLMVRNECILVYAAENDARAAAKDHRDFKSGLEPLRPGLDAKGQPIDLRLPKRRNKQIGAVGPSDVIEAAA